jgi:amidohydrolase
MLTRAADGKLARAPLAGTSEDFSFYAQRVPGLFVFLRVIPPDQGPARAAPNNGPRFFVVEDTLVVGTRTLASTVVAFLGAKPRTEALRSCRPFVQMDR